MLGPKKFQPKATPPGFEVAMVPKPDPELNRRFYNHVGSQWQWTDRLTWSEDEWHDYVHREELQTWVGQLNGKPIGYFELEVQDDGNTEIVYLGLLPEYIGQGMGGALLSADLAKAWDRPSARSVWLQTSSLDI